MRRCFNAKKVLKGSERRPFISNMNAATQIQMTSVLVDARAAHISALIKSALAGK